MMPDPVAGLNAAVDTMLATRGAKPVEVSARPVPADPGARLNAAVDAMVDAMLTTRGAKPAEVSARPVPADPGARLNAAVDAMLARRGQ